MPLMTSGMDVERATSSAFPSTNFMAASISGITNMPVTRAGRLKPSASCEQSESKARALRF